VTSTVSLNSSTDLSVALADSFPSLARYCPHLQTISLPQALFLLDDAQEAFYGGAAGGGKSDALLSAGTQYADVPGYAGLILRRSFTDLALPGAIMDRAHQWFTGKPGTHWSHERKTWTFGSGATLTFGYLENERDVYRYQSSEYQFIGFDELTQFSEAQYTYMFSRLRRTAGIDAPLRMRSASNPGGTGHGWVKKRFITERAPNVVFVPAKVDDNPGLAVDEYRASLKQLSPVLQQQLLDGDWGAFEGAAYPHFDKTVHVLPKVDVPDVPAEWDRFECMDFGVSNPTAWYPVATDYDGNLIVFDEHYQAGLPTDTAPVILERRKQGWEPHDDRGWKLQSNVVWADPSTRNRAPIAGRFGNQTSVAQEFADQGVPLTPANNDRQARFVRISELLRPDDTRRFPAWHPRYGDTGCPRIFFANCPRLVEQLETAPLETTGKPLGGEAVDRDWEGQHGHGHAALGYGVMSRPNASVETEALPDDPREYAWVASERRHFDEDFDEDNDDDQLKSL
jgi:hypothetical protein